jgi:hypothetical protein
LQQNTLLEVLRVVNIAALPMHTAQTNVWLFGSLEGTSLLDSHKINTPLENYFFCFQQISNIRVTLGSSNMFS